MGLVLPMACGCGDVTDNTTDDEAMLDPRALKEKLRPESLRGGEKALTSIHHLYLLHE